MFLEGTHDEKVGEMESLFADFIKRVAFDEEHIFVGEVHMEMETQRLKKGRRYVDRRPVWFTGARDAELIAAAPPSARASGCSGSDLCCSSFGGCNDAHCLRSHPGGVTVLVINADEQHPYELTMTTAGERYTFSARRLQDPTVQLNNSTLRLSSQGDLPQLAGEPTRPGRISFAPETITFLATPASNNNCQ
jgi:hypothetical protein